MIIKWCFYTMIAAYLILSFQDLQAGTDIIITPNSAMNSFDFSDEDKVRADYEQFIRSFMSKNSDVLGTGFALANTLGYPNGKSIIGQFPHFQIGVAGGAAVYKYKRYKDFDKDNLENNPTVPGGGANAAVHFGTGITSDIDITFKLFVLDYVYDVDYTYDKDDDEQSFVMDFNDSSIFSIGTKVRYNFIKEKKLIPWLFNFGGMTANLGVDYMQGRVSGDSTYSKTADTDFTTSRVSPGPDYSEEHTIETEGTVYGDGEFKWHIISLTPEVFVYADFFYFLTIYTGPSVSFNYGSVELNISSSGYLKTNEDITVNDPLLGPTILAYEDDKIATIQFDSNNKMRPAIVIPKWIVGVEFNLGPLKLQVEAGAVLTSITDSAIAQVGMRMDL